MRLLAALLACPAPCTCLPGRPHVAPAPAEATAGCPCSVPQLLVRARSPQPPHSRGAGEQAPGPREQRSRRLGEQLVAAAPKAAKPNPKPVCSTRHPPAAPLWAYGPINTGMPEFASRAIRGYSSHFWLLLHN
jgi:hypothetical protein